MPQPTATYEIEMEWRQGRSKQVYLFEVLLDNEFEIADPQSINGQCIDDSGTARFTLDRNGRFHFDGEPSDHFTDILQRKMTVGEKVTIRYSPADPPWVCTITSVMRK